MPDGSDRPRQRVCDVPLRHVLTHEFQEKIWPQIEPFLANALATDEMGRYTTADVQHMLMVTALLAFDMIDPAVWSNPNLRLWISYDAESKKFEMAAITQVIQYPRCREFRIWLVGGRNMKAWRDQFMGQTESLARAEECPWITGAGLRAWTRAAPGYHTAGYNLVKKLY